MLPSSNRNPVSAKAQCLIIALERISKRSSGRLKSPFPRSRQVSLVGSLQYAILGWDEIYEMCIHLARKVRKSHYSPDIIVGIARGGWIPARILSDIMENPNVAHMKIEFYVDVGKTFSQPRITQDVSSSVAGMRLLVVDDVADSGKTLSLVRESLMKRGAAEVRIATLHYKPKSVTKPEYYVAETEAWIVYPHERFEFMRSRTEKMRSEKPREEIKQDFLKMGIPKTAVDEFFDYFSS